MVSVPPQQNHPFPEAAMMFDLERLKTDLEKYGEVTDAPWQYFMGILSGYSQKEIASQFGKEEETVKQSLTQRLKDSIIGLLGWPENTRIKWSRIPQQLISAGYGLSAQETCTTLEKEIFRNMLDEQRKKLTSNSLMSKNGFRSNRNFDDIYVPLGLVKPKDEPKRDLKTFENDPRRGSHFYRLADYEVTEKFSNTEFFDKVLDQEKCHRLAIVGEPGAGKTTLLQKISTWIEENRPDDQIIWVPLSKIKNQSLADYLLDNWLRNAKDVSEITKAEKDALIDIFKAGNVWLLLDGVDEMGINNPLFNLHEQITGCWLKYAKIILSCRLNVWEAGINHLHDFEVYRNRDFFDSEQRNQFIKNYFKKDPTLGEQLITELNREVTERIRDLVKNPLRLTMICFSWYKNKGKLPDTKAELYQEYVDGFYDWKAGEVFSTTPTERRELNQALGELAKNALEQDSAWFSITHQQICECEYLGNPKEEGLGKKAIELGWLNEVGVSEENADDKVYAFFHPSFQEYFAALAIDDWNYFFPRNFSLSLVQASLNNDYKIFDRGIKDIAIYWIGRKDVKISDKEEFLLTLLDFTPTDMTNAQDNAERLIYSLYEDRAYSIAIELFCELSSKQKQSLKLIDKITSIIYQHIFNQDKYKRFGIEATSLYKDALAKLEDTIKLNIIANIINNLNQNTIWINYQYHALDLLQINQDLDKNKVMVNEIFKKMMRKNYDYADFFKVKFIDLTWSIIDDKKEVQEVLKDIIKNRIDDQSDNHTFLLCNCLSLLETLKITNKDRANLLTINELIDIADKTKSAEVCVHYLGAIYINLQEKKSINNKLTEYIIQINNLTNEDIRLKYPQDNHGEICEVYDDTPPHDVVGSKTYFPLVDEIRDLCNELSRQIVETDSKQSEPFSENIPTSQVDKNQKLKIESKAQQLQENFKPSTEEDIEVLINHILNQKLEDYYNHLTYIPSPRGRIVNPSTKQDEKKRALENLKNVNDLQLLKIIVNKLYSILSNSNNSVFEDEQIRICFQAIWHCAKILNLQNFIDAWRISNIHPEVADYTSIGENTISQTLNQQILDLPSQLQPTQKTYPIVINAQSLEDETDNDSIAQELCNQIYAIAFPNETDIPEINNAPKLKRLIPNIKKQLNTQNLALIFHNGEPNESLNKFCKKLTDVIHIKWITEQPIAYGVPPQENLVNILQNWIDHLG